MIFVNAALPAALPRAADPARAALGLERWLEAGRAADPATAGFAADLAADPRGRALLEAVLGNSPHLTESLLREPAFLRRIAEDGLDAAFEWTLAQMEAAGREAADMPPLMAALRHGKRRGALAIALADIAGQWPLMRITGALSRLAEAALQPAAALLLRQAAAAGRIELPDPADAAAGSGLIVLGMGKLGARELNYSSDIDLIVFYDDGRIRTKRPDDLRQTFVRIARDLVRLMDERTGDGYVFRTDLRLRPDPAATPLAVSVTAAEQYYGSLGQNWERAAMIKARPVAGDPQAGAELLKILRPFVWRRNLDFYAIQDIHSIKRQIHAHRGGERPAVNGHNIKLGRGGIREIEFYAQTQQLIHGGRDPRLRVAGTLEALQLLVDTGRIAQGVADDLSRAYGYLRRLEHRLQMVDDRQTHSLPESDEAVAAIGTFMGHADTDEFRRTLMETLELVEGHYARLFEEHETLSGPGNLVFTGKMDDPQTLETLKGLGFQEPGRVAAAIRAWHFGRYRATRSTRARELLTELTPALLAALGGTPQPDHAFTKFDDFLSRLPAGVQLFSLFQANPDLLALVAEIMGTAPRLAERLAQTPELFDAMLTPGYFGPLPGRDALAAELDLLLSTARDFEDVLSLTRRWTTDHRFQVGVQLLRHRAQADAAAPFLSDVAELVLGALLPHVEAEFARRHGRVPGGGMA
ncbi:MAG TPA: bifunctional [glutamine synthetase] adenylyltransferase/[glutamine synthetase]-adenylyl-L-tyrosine phosphorylase, partial [Alphaproteobacteria bacterium]|nr:bifunctional [glutamine synthetase] adenylyltransferase/[glutamine synthetase]-adenylyl-L-tyrosine phosphorylase [Alphaproteobacteria bacterium]